MIASFSARTGCCAERCCADEGAIFLFIICNKDKMHDVMNNSEKVTQKRGVFVFLNCIQVDIRGTVVDVNMKKSKRNGIFYENDRFLQSLMS